MSSSISYLFNSDKSFEQLVKELNDCLGCNFELDGKHEEHVYSRFFGIGFDFYIHSFENDGTVNFQDYKYYIGSSVLHPELKDTELSVMALIANILYYKMNISEGILVYDVQSILAKYEEMIIREDTRGVFDAISCKFVEFPQHFIDLDKLAWQ